MEISLRLGTSTPLPTIHQEKTNRNNDNFEIYSLCFLEKE